MANLGLKKRKWEIFYRLFFIFPKTSIGSCKNHHLGRLLIKSGYTLDMKHKSLITLSAYILKTKCKNLAIFPFFSLWKSTSILNFEFSFRFLAKLCQLKKRVGYMRSLILAWTNFMLMVFVLYGNFFLDVKLANIELSNIRELFKY